MTGIPPHWPKARTPAKLFKPVAYTAKGDPIYDDGMNAKQRRKAHKLTTKAATGKHEEDQATRLRGAVCKETNRWFRSKLDGIESEPPSFRYGVVWTEYNRARDKLPFPPEVIEKLDATFLFVSQPQMDVVMQRFEGDKAQARVQAHVGVEDWVDDWFSKPTATPWWRDLQWWLDMSSSFIDNEGQGVAGTAEKVGEDAHTDAGAVARFAEAKDPDTLDVKDKETRDVSK